MPAPKEPIVDNQMEELEGKSPEDLQALLDQEMGVAQPSEAPSAEGEQPAEPTGSSEPAKADPPADFAERLTRLEKQNQDKESFIQRQAAEIGLLRKQIRDSAKPPEIDVPDEEFHANPKEAVRKALHQAKQREIEEKEASDKHIQETRATFKSAIEQWAPDFETKVPDLANLMKKDEASDQLVQQFRSDPVATLNPAVIFQLLKRLDAEKKIVELEKKLAEASQQTKTTVSRIQNAGRAKPVATSSAPSPKAHASLDNLTEEDIDSMSREELEKLYKTLK